MKRIIIIGGGPGGYVAAIKAAQMGAEVELVENEHLGGTCLNVGCIPTKSLLHASLFYRKIKSNTVPGVNVDGAKYDWREIQREKQAVVKKLVGGVKGLLMANRVKVHTGHGELLTAHTVAVDGKALPRADAIIIATGSAPAKIRFPGSDLDGVIDSTQALSIEDVPKSISIVGGGVIGVELASIYNALGSKVTIVEMMPAILPPLDGQISELMQGVLAGDGIDIYTGTKLIGVMPGEGTELVSQLEVDGAQKLVSSDFVLVAVGRKPNTEDLGLEKLGVEKAGTAIAVDDNFQTSVPGVFAIGDVNGKTMLAHVASAQGEAAVEYIMEGIHHYRGNAIPSCVYTEPEIACVGLTEEQAKSEGLAYNCGIFNLAGNGKSTIGGDNTGFVKIIADRELGEILGAHVVASNATEMIGEMAVAMSMEGVVADICNTVHAHPTVGESIREAALATFGSSIHWPPSK